jgi:hypothetical protein
VTLLRDLKYTITPTAIGTTATMASGRTVMDFVGEKNVLTIPTGWLSAADLATLRAMIRRYHVLDITYDEPEGERTAAFLVDQPELRSFRYGADGVTVWYGVTLKATEYEVVTV